jgi:hypothetical protein
MICCVQTGVSGGCCRSFTALYAKDRLAQKLACADLYGSQVERLPRTAQGTERTTLLTPREAYHQLVVTVRRTNFLELEPLMAGMTRMVTVSVTPSPTGVALIS